MAVRHPSHDCIVLCLASQVPLQDNRRRNIADGKYTVQDERHAAREKKLEAIRNKTAKSEKTAELKAAGKSFYKQMITDSDYQGEDYEVFAKWLSQGHGEGEATED